MKSKKAKKFLCLLMVLTLLSGLLIGCRTKPENSNVTTTTEEPSVTSSTTWNIHDGMVHPPIYDYGYDLSLVPDDPYYELGLLWSAERIALEDTWDLTTGSATIRVGVIDSGIDASHPDLVNNINTELSESYVDGCSPLEDSVGHGTHVAGIIGAQGNNLVGTTGVCWNIEIISLRVVDDNGYINDDDLVYAIEDANSKGIHILNISITALEISNEDELYDAITGFNGLVVCAAGNYNTNSDLISVYPSCVSGENQQDLPNLMSVGASTNADVRSDFSCYGASTVDIFAPGTSILNCYPTELCCSNINCDSPNHTQKHCDATTHTVNGYHSMSGTSMAAPHVAGVAALMLSIHPELTAAELKYILMNSVDMVFDDELNNVFIDLCISGGRLNAYKALTHTSLHNFSTWVDVDSVYHSRTCADCGYTQYQTHAECWNSLKNICIACKRTGTIGGGSILQIPDEEDSQ